MNDDELIGYCSIHCTTERALFHRDHINRMVELAGNPPGFTRVVDEEFLSAKESMRRLVELARERQKAKDRNHE